MKAFFILIFSSMAFGQVLLVPDAKVDFETYKIHCQKEGYSCTMNFQLKQIQMQSTPQFDSLLDQLDYSSEVFRSVLVNRVLTVLKEEPISIEQAEVLTKVLEQAQNFSTGPTLKQMHELQNQILETIDLVKNNVLTDLPATYSVVFKKPIPVTTIKKMKPYLFKIKVDRVDYNHALSSSEDLVTGVCENANIHSSIENQKCLVDSEVSCGFTDQFQKISSSTGSFLRDHQTALITTGLVLVGAAILMNNYEVKLSF